METNELRTIININRQIYSIGMVYDYGNTPFNVVSYICLSDKDVLPRYHAENEVPNIALLSSFHSGVRASVNGFTKDLYFVNIKGDNSFSGLDDCVVALLDYKKSLNTNSEYILVINLKSKTRTEIPLSDVSLKLTDKWNVTPSGFAK